MKKQSKRSLTSLNGKRSITAREFDRLFDEGSDEIDQFIDWSAAEVQTPAPKKPVTLRIDADVLNWFKSLGKGYQTKMNAVLRIYKRNQERRKVANVSAVKASRITPG
jgi:uncharacterized protein (DUF4415 family)